MLLRCVAHPQCPPCTPPSAPIWRSHPSRPGPSRSRPVPQVLDAVSTYNALRLACGVPDDAFGRPAFDKVLQATLVSQVPHRTKSLMTKLDENWKLRPAAHGTIRVLVSGAGPTGLRAAVEAALMGMRVPTLTVALALTLALTLT